MSHDEEVLVEAQINLQRTVLGAAPGHPVPLLLLPVLDKGKIPPYLMWQSVPRIRQFLQA